jgi:hypothetical protein
LSRFVPNLVGYNGTKGGNKRHDGEFAGLARGGVLKTSIEKEEKRFQRKRPHHKGPAMNLKAWEPTIQQIADEFSLASSEAVQHRILTAWRAKLAKEPTSLPSLRIDEIVREVRRKVTVASR